VGAVLAALSPAFRDAEQDSFPLSTYPMFARTLDKPELSFVERVDDKRHVQRLTPEHVGSDEVMQSYRVIKRAVREGPAAARSLCRTVAQRLAEREHHRRDVKLRVVSARFDPVAYFVEDAEPESRVVIASCSARRAP
jgi:hypothetical protein